MTIELYWEPTLYSIIISTLWIFRDTTLVLWARNMKKRGVKSKNSNILLSAGIILLAWNIIYFFLPYFRLSSYTESDFRTLGTIYFLYDLIPIILGVFLGIVLTIYFFSEQDQRNRKALVGPGILILGYIIMLFFIINYYYVTIEDPLLFISNYNAYVIGIAVSYILPVIGFFFVFLHSLHIKNEFLIMFCGLFFAYLALSLIYNINFAIDEFNFFG